MNKTELLQNIHQYIGTEEPICISPDDTKKILIAEIPADVEIEVCEMDDEGIRHIEIEGNFSKRNGKFYLNVSQNWYRKWWTRPLGMAHHMDLIKRLVEFRQKENKDIEDIEFEDEGDWCHLYYSIIISDEINTLYEAYDFCIDFQIWIDRILHKVQEKIGLVVNEIANEYSSFKLLESPEIIYKIEHESDSNIKGRLLEELISKLFRTINGFEIIERLKTDTEEIDLVILNKSENPLWQKESQLILVECKNWSGKCGKNELVIFKEKIHNRRGRSKIGFFISWNGFTKTFTKEDLRSSHEDILIIPVTGKEIIESLNESFEKNMEKWWVNAIST